VRIAVGVFAGADIAGKQQKAGETQTIQGHK